VAFRSTLIAPGPLNKLCLRDENALESTASISTSIRPASQSLCQTVQEHGIGCESEGLAGYNRSTVLRQELACCV
jgi:hypothetical protein